MKEFNLEDLKYEDLENPLIKGVYFDILGFENKPLINIRSSSYVPMLNFKEPEFVEGEGDFIIIKFDDIKEMKKPLSYFTDNSEYIPSYYNYIQICNFKVGITKEKFDIAKEENILEEIFDLDTLFIEHIEDFKEKIFNEYFENDLYNIFKNMKESIEYRDLESFRELKEDFKILIEQLDNVNFCSKNSTYKKGIDFSEYFENDDIKNIKKLIQFQKIEEMSIEEFSNLNEISGEAGEFEGTDIFYTNNEENIQVCIHLDETHRTIEEYCNDKELMQDLKNLTLKEYQKDLDIEFQELEEELEF